MSLRARVVLTLVVLSVAATVAVGVSTYRSTSRALRSEVDRSLVDAADRTGARGQGRPRPGFPERFAQPRGAGDVVVQQLGPRGTPLFTDGVELPVADSDREVAASLTPRTVLRDDELDGTPIRILTTSRGGGRGAVQAARSLVETQRVLAQLGRRTVLTVIVVGGLAAAAGAFFASQATRRLSRLTEAAESVAATGDLSVGVPVSGNDETGRLGESFNAMLSALARSRDQQRRLVQDAGHELRTPLTSLRTNVFALSRFEELSEEDRRRLLEDLRSETEELAALVDEVVELATDRRGDEPVTTFDLGEVARRVAQRAERRTGRRVVVTTASPVPAPAGAQVVGRESAIERAVSNIVENACKFDPTGPVEVHVAEGQVWVGDHGPGIDEEDLPKVFDRFHRAESARGLPGSGLGLAIVADIVGSHGGTVHAGNHPEGGAVVGFSLPGVPADNRPDDGPPTGEPGPFSPSSHLQRTVDQRSFPNI